MKKTMLLLLASTLLLTLAACGEQTAPPAATDPVTDSAGTVEPADTAAPIPAALPLAENGTSDYVIVRSASASGEEIHAAEVFHSYFKQITGAKLPIVTDDTPAVLHEIVIGRTNRETEGAFDRDELGEDGFIVKTEAGKLWLIGGSGLSTEYAVYGFLEDHLGCRFYTQEFEKVPSTPTISLEIAEDKQIPVFNSRTMYYEPAGYDPEFRLKRKVNDGDGYVQAVGIHSLPGLAGTGDGDKGPDPCLTSEETFNTVMASLRAALDAKPGSNYVSVSQCDGGIETFCHCDACMARVEEYGWSGHYLLFVNRVAEALAAEYPGVTVHTFAYGDTATLPPPKKEMRAADNVLIQICTGACGVHALGECTAGGVDFGEVFDGWSKVSQNLYIWDYCICYNCYLVPYPGFSAYLGDYNLFGNSGVTKIFELGPNSRSGKYGEFDYLRTYLIRRLAWDPLMTEEEYYGYMDEYLEDWYGPGWRHIRDFITFSEEAVSDTHILTNTLENYAMEVTEGAAPTLTADQIRNFKKVDWEPYWDCMSPVTPHRIIVEGPAYFEAALAEAETDEQRWRIKRSAIQIDVLKSIWMYYRRNIAKRTLPDVYTAALDAAVAAGEIAESERGTLLFNFKKFFKTNLEETYTAYNLALAQRCVEHEIYEIAEYTPGDFSITPIDSGAWFFDTAPCYWDSGMGR